MDNTFAFNLLISILEHKSCWSKNIYMADLMRDEIYLQIILKRLEVCKKYKPKFGQRGEGISYTEFKRIYSEDIFYSWFGLDNPLMYSAHKAAGGITSVYRQIGIGSEELFRQILQDELKLTTKQATWSYQIARNDGRTRTLTLDGRVKPADIQDEPRRKIVESWMSQVSESLSLHPKVADAMQGLVMEIRQGYKSKDSKRQNADMANASEAYTQGYLPILIVMSSQIDSDIVERYKRGKWFVLRGNLEESPLLSTFSFMKDVVGYDLASFFERNASTIREFTHDVLENLLKADDNG
jgi:hypothetical protein